MKYLLENKIFGIGIEVLSKEQVLEKIKKYILTANNFVHVVSLNSENLIVAHENKLYLKVIKSAQIRIIDGAGVVAAGQILNISVGERVTGVGLTSDLMRIAQEMRLRVLLIGGKPNLAESIAKCQSKLYSRAKFVGITGIKDIKNPRIEEEAKIFSIVIRLRPHLIFASFGSPDQEIWLWKSRSKLKGIVCMGVGGAFDFMAGGIRRAPIFVRQMGLEWLFRLILEPWRWRRQLRLIKFIWLVLREKYRLLWKKRF